MNIFQKIITSRFIKLLIAIAGILGTIITIYSFIVSDKKTEVSYEIIASTNVLDINTDISKLDIIYDKSSLKKNNQNLKLFTIRIINSGSENILKSSFDDNDLWGISITNGKIIENPEIIGTNSDYISKNLNIKSDKTQIIFSKIIFEPTDFFIIKLLVLNDKTSLPEIKAIGKIAGVKSFSITDLSQNNKTQSVLRTVFYGNIYVQMIRAFIYTIITMVVLIILAFIIIIIIEYFEKRKRKQIIEDYKKSNKKQISTLDELILKRYVDNKLTLLFRYQFELNDFNEFIKEVKIEEHLNKKKNALDSSRSSIMNDYVDERFNQKYLLERMLDDGLVVKDGKKYIINKSAKMFLNDFINYMKKNNSSFKSELERFETI